MISFRRNAPVYFHFCSCVHNPTERGRIDHFPISTSKASSWCLGVVGASKHGSPIIAVNRSFAGGVYFSSSSMFVDACPHCKQGVDRAVRTKLNFLSITLNLPWFVSRPYILQKLHAGNWCGVRLTKDSPVGQSFSPTNRDFPLLMSRKFGRKSGRVNSSFDNEKY